MIDIDNLTIKKLHEMYTSKTVTVSEVVSAYMQRIKERNDELNVYLEVFSDTDQYIKIAQEKIDNGTASFLTGVPIAIKDNMLWQDHHVTSASKMLVGYVANYSSPVILKLLEEGAIIMGRTNMDEFAMGASTENSAFGPTKNPVDISRVPGGSSGGSAAAVAGGMALCAIGSDTGGSIRQPAAFCGVVGMKPTYGFVTRYGLIAMASSLDQIGPFAKNCTDAEILFNALNFYDKNDGTLIPMGQRENMKTVPKKRIGVPYSFIEKGVDIEVKDAFTKTIKDLEGKGYEIIDVELPLTPLSLAVYYILMPAEVSSNLARFDGIRYGNKPDPAPINSITDFYKNVKTNLFGAEVRRRCILGAFILSHGYYDAYYNKAIALQAAIKSEFVEAFKDLDYIMMPTTPTLPFKFGEKSGDPLAMYLADLFTAPANIAGLPAVSVPLNVSDGELPIGIQIISAHGNDLNLFSIGTEIENLV